MPKQDFERPHRDDGDDDTSPLPGPGKGGGKKKKPGRDPVRDIIDEIQKDDTLKKRQKTERDRVQNRKEKSGE